MWSPDPLLMGAVAASLDLAYDAGIERGEPGSAAFMAAVVHVIRHRLARVWTLPADPDETLRLEEAGCYEQLIADPGFARDIMLMVGDRRVQ